MSAERCDQHPPTPPGDQAAAMDRAWEEFVPPDGLTAQYLLGQIVVQANPPVLHMQTIFDIGYQIGRGRIEAWPETGVDLGRDGRPRADVLFIDPDAVDPAWRDVPASVPFGVAEVVSESSVTMDYRDKTKAYARHRIPVYLIVDPRDGSWTVMELVDSADGPMYIAKSKGRYGEAVALVLGGAPVRLETGGWHRYPGPA